MISVEGLTVRFGGVHALDALTVELDAAVVGIIGPNGAGKTTLLNVVSGFVPVRDGRVTVDGVDVLAMSPSRRARWGVRRTFQTELLADELTVADNVRIAAENTRAGRAGRGARGARAATDAVLDVVGLVSLRGRQAGTLSGGEQQMLALAQALVSNPQVVLADEMSLGLAPVVVRRLVEVVAALAEAGTGVLLIEQFTNVALDLAERVLVLERGRVRFDGTAAELRSRPDVLDAAYLGVGPR